MENLTPQEIATQVYNVFESMEDQLNDPIYHYTKDTTGYLTLSYINYEDDHKEITPKKAHTLILEAIQKSLNDHQKVLLYYCPDNALITIEHLVKDEELSYFDQEANNFFIGKD